MAQWWTDFSEHDAGTGTYPTGWAHRAGTVADGGPWTVQTDVDEGKVLRSTDQDWSSSAVVWEEPGEISGDVEMVAKVRAGGLDNIDGPCLRAGAAGDPFLMHTTQSGPTIYLARFNGASNDNASPASLPSLTWTGWVWFRARIEGSLYYLRVWQDGAEEPATWNVYNGYDMSGNASLSPHGTSGYVGWSKMNVNTSPPIEVSVFGLTDDLTAGAPTEEPAEGFPVPDEEVFWGTGSRPGATMTVPTPPSGGRGSGEATLAVPAPGTPGDIYPTPGLPWTPRVSYDVGPTIFDFTLPMIDWTPGKEEVGTSTRFPSGAREAYLINRFHLLDIIVEFTEREWPDVAAFIETVQDGALSFDFYPDKADLGTSHLVYLASPVMGERWMPTRGQLPGLWRASLTLESADGTRFDIQRHPSP